jgi:hypothetical protein
MKEMPMRRYLLVVPFIIACGGAEAPPADSAAAAMTPMLTDADFAGNWAGNLMAEGSDSVVGTWSDSCGGGTCRLVSAAAPNDTVVFTYTIAGDSAMYSAGPHKDAAMGGAMITDAGVARVSGNQITGSGIIRLADNPDSVVMRYRFTGTKQP